MHRIIELSISLLCMLVDVFFALLLMLVEAMIFVSFRLMRALQTMSASSNAQTVLLTANLEESNFKLFEDKVQPSCNRGVLPASIRGFSRPYTT